MERVRDVMTAEPVTLDAASPIRRAAALMKERDVGDVLVTEDGELHGILTDRDIVVRALATGRDLDGAIGEICTTSPVTVGPEDALDAARDRMRKRAVRRIPVVDEENQPVGIVSLGDLAIERAPRSALGRISAAPSNTATGPVVPAPPPPRPRRSYARLRSK